MAELPNISLKDGKSSGKTKASDLLFDAPLRADLINEYVIMQRRAMRAGNASTKTRAEVSGTGKKPFRQKGTGNARQGTLRGPHQYHGGICFGPKPREYYSSINRKVKGLTLCSALSHKVHTDSLAVIDGFDISSGKSKDASSALKHFANKKILIIGEFSEASYRAVKNMKNVRLLSPAGLNVYDILNANHVFISKEALAECEKRISGMGVKKEAA